MAFPWIFESNFEAGTNGEWDSETDAASQLDFPHYTELGRYPWRAAPHSGAYCMRAVLSGGTADAVVSEGDIDIADTVTRWFRFNVWFSPTFDATADDTVALFELQGSGNAVTASVGFRYVAATDVINIGIGGAASGAVPGNWDAAAIERNVWYTVEAKVNIETDASGTVDLYVTKDGLNGNTTAVASGSSITNIAVTHGVLGIQDHLATTTGVILIDDFVMDDAQLFHVRDRYPFQKVMTKSGHAFVGPGQIDIAALLSTGADNVLKLYDTDIALVNDDQGFVTELDMSAFSSVEGPLTFYRGCYCELAGTSPRAHLIFENKRPQHWTDREIHDYGLKGGPR